MSDDGPAIELDFGVGRIYVQGDENTTFDEVREEFDDQKEDMKETIRELKEFDYQLRDEYDEVADSPRGPSGFS